MRNIIMEKTYKRIPFDIELAKKIQSGEVEGRFIYKESVVRILCFDMRTAVKSGELRIVVLRSEEYSDCLYYFDYNGIDVCTGNSLFIELPEETPKHEFKPFDKVLVRENNSQVWHCDFFAYTDSVHNIHYCVAHSGCQILPYKGNEYLVGTTDNPKEE